MKRLACLLVLVPSIAAAEEPDVDEKSAEAISWTDIGMTGSARSAASSWLILPKGWEASGELKFLTSDRPPGGEAMKLTDVVISRASLRRSFGGKVEVS